MITYEEALKKARERKPNLNCCTEYKNGYMFSSTEDKGYKGGYGHTPVIVLKENGNFCDVAIFLCTGMSGKEIKSFKVKGKE